MSFQSESLQGLSAQSAVRAVPVKADADSLLRLWRDGKAGLFAALEPVVSSYLINGGTKVAMAEPAKATGIVGAIHAGTRVQDKAAQAMFVHLLSGKVGERKATGLPAYKPGMFALDQDAHDEALMTLGAWFVATITPVPKAKTAKPAAAAAAAAQGDKPATPTAGTAAGTAALTGAMVAAAIRAGAFSADDVAEIFAACKAVTPAKVRKPKAGDVTDVTDVQSRPVGALALISDGIAG